MKLTDLNPKLEGTLFNGVLRFDCPLGHGHKFRVPLGGTSRWQAQGHYPDLLTITPSIDANVHASKSGGKKPVCSWHGFITEGEIR